jgi:ApaG protein
MTGMFTTTTHNIKVTVFPVYLEEQSLPDEDHYVWAYTVHLENHGLHTVQLISRYWHITDSHGMIQEVRGSGVVGEQPSLPPGETYQYTSGAALHTPSGLMTGHYEMKNEDGSAFTIEIPVFSLDSPEQKQRPN